MSEQEVEKMVQDDEPTPDPSTISKEDHLFAKPQVSSTEVEKLEEAKLKAKYPMGGGPLSGHSAFLQKKLAKGQKYFDSGDYQMAKQTPGGALKARQVQATNLSFGTGEAIPTPDSVPARKTSIIQPKFAPSSTT